MRKSILSVAVIALLASCNGGNNQQTQQAETEEVKSFEQEQIEAGIKVQIDSLAALYNSKQDIPFMAALKKGELLLSDEEKQVKPDYLIDPASTNELTTFSQKYRAVAVLSIDKYLAKLHDMSVEDYDAAIARLIVDINDPAYDTFVKGMDGDSTRSVTMTEFYDAEDEAGRLNFFWESAAAALVEQTYAITLHPDEFLACFTDEDAQDFTFRIILILNGLDHLQSYAPELKELCVAVKPLEELNAISVDQLREQVDAMKDKIAVVRNSLLK